MAYSTYNSTWERYDNSETVKSWEESGLGWGNNIAAVRWNHIFNQRLFANFTGTFTLLLVASMTLFFMVNVNLVFIAVT